MTLDHVPHVDLAPCFQLGVIGRGFFTVVRLSFSVQLLAPADLNCPSKVGGAIREGMLALRTVVKLRLYRFQNKTPANALRWKQPVSRSTARTAVSHAKRHLVAWRTSVRRGWAVIGKFVRMLARCATKGAATNNYRCGPADHIRRGPAQPQQA